MGFYPFDTHLIFGVFVFYDDADESHVDPDMKLRMKDKTPLTDDELRAFFTRVDKTKKFKVYFLFKTQCTLDPDTMHEVSLISFEVSKDDYEKYLV